MIILYVNEDWRKKLNRFKCRSELLLLWGILEAIKSLLHVYLECIKSLSSPRSDYVQIWSIGKLGGANTFPAPFSKGSTLLWDTKILTWYYRCSRCTFCEEVSCIVNWQVLLGTRLKQKVKSNKKYWINKK